MKSIFSLKDVERLLASEAARRVGATNGDGQPLDGLIYQASAQTVSTSDSAGNVGDDAESVVVIDVQLPAKVERLSTVKAEAAIESAPAVAAKKRGRRRGRKATAKK